jgi:hypothetical protein
LLKTNTYRRGHKPLLFSYLEFINARQGFALSYMLENTGIELPLVAIGVILLLLLVLGAIVVTGALFTIMLGDNDPNGLGAF